MFLLFGRQDKNAIDVVDCDKMEIIKTITLTLHNGISGVRNIIDNKENIYVINSFDATLSIIEKSTFKEIKSIPIGSYPVDIQIYNDNIYICCADSNCIWTLDTMGEVIFIDNNIWFPFCIDCKNDSIVIGCFFSGEIIVNNIYTFQNILKNKINGLVEDVIFINDLIVVSYNCIEEKPIGKIAIIKEDNKLDFYTCDRIGKIKLFNGFIYAVSQEKQILCIDKNLFSIANIIDVGETIEDFIICKDYIFVSLMMKNSILKYSLSGELLSEIKTISPPKCLYITNELFNI